MKVIRSVLEGFLPVEAPRPEPTGIVYRIANIVDGRVYIGKTERSFSKRYRGFKWWKHTHNQELKADYERLGQDSFEVTIMGHGFKASELVEAERFLIWSHQSLHPNGYNRFRDGGAATEATRAKMSASGKRRMEKFPNPFKGKKHTEETKEWLRQINTGKKLSEEHKSKIRAGSKRGLESPWYTSMTEEAKNVARDSLKSGREVALPRVQKPVLQRHPKDGALVARFQSIEDASKAVNMFHQNISISCHSADRTCGGFKWEFENGTSPRASYPINLQVRPVCKIDSLGQRESFVSLSEAARSVKVSGGNLAAAIRHKWKCRGYNWEYVV